MITTDLVELHINMVAILESKEVLRSVELLVMAIL